MYSGSQSGGTDQEQNVSLLVAGDHELLRDAISEILRREGGFSVEVTGSREGVLKQIEERGGFDVILLDLQMPGMSGLDSLREVATSNANGAVAILAGELTRDVVMSAFKAGARGYIPKTLPLRALPIALRLIASGESYVPAWLTNGGGTTQADGPSFDLLPEELQILEEVSDGRTNKQIAFTLNVTEGAIKMKMRAICMKLGAKNRTHAVVIARQHMMLR
ncbi:response regulator [Rhodobacter sphaeroides]|jgi:Response regulator containing a CheY-like receiver domain and an HTH DNA-binding domain|uniref:response regulator n=1 Tax=Cereibacter sphaeroides TaxID=1063 RepID=UPI00005C821B|nr:response regulator transcription factor [Cereibacter sphaeroides]ANS36706.1 DNA-binding response regulator [Cereibacter sphaeroides]ATN65872.1 DNA-binding response regulator [Cereibacter sphaeroides]AXC64036.1 DNA-binding response regulator [Cereibacter sphaeroides 2.4.1]MVX50383.1 response regulator [Cereibacter sphaeroides]QHA12175.1 response regulator [Cereibacter sphaeroides]